ncbi:hypothetical protein DMA11_15690 [Marinilabiliaceae bacterium JC017]|nr:hypothetical protein DMA11_15690 [Marinilabiliaceae bacterium JC017]
MIVGGEGEVKQVFVYSVIACFNFSFSRRNSMLLLARVCLFLMIQLGCNVIIVVRCHWGIIISLEFSLLLIFLEE